MESLEARFIAMAELTLRRHERSEPSREGERTLQAWLDLLTLHGNRVRWAAGHGNDPQAEYDIWIDIAQLALGRAEQIITKEVRNA